MGGGGWRLRVFRVNENPAKRSTAISLSSADLGVVLPRDFLAKTLFPWLLSKNTKGNLIGSYYPMAGSIGEKYDKIIDAFSVIFKMSFW